MTNSQFINRLKICLSIYFNQEEINDICCDYSTFLEDSNISDPIKQYGTPLQITKELATERKASFNWKSPILFATFIFLFGIFYYSTDFKYNIILRFFQFLFILLPFILFSTKRTFSKSFMIFNFIFILHSCILLFLPAYVTKFTEALWIGPLYVRISTFLYIIDLLFIIYSLLHDFSSYQTTILTGILFSLSNYINLLHSMDRVEVFPRNFIITLLPFIFAYVICIIHKGVKLWMHN